MRSQIKLATLLVIICAVVGGIMLVPVAAAAETGQISGQVLDERSKEPLIGVSVLIEGTTIGAKTNIDGIYTIKNAPAGAQTLVFSSVGYAKKRVTGVQVSAARPAVLDVVMTAETIEMKSITVEAERVRANESRMLIQRRNAPNVTDGITSEVLEKSGDSDAGDAVKRVVGVSVVDNKALVVRGMGGRYANLRLDGATLPSPEPEKREVPLDLFPTGLIEEVVASKTFTPDQPGNFTGGSVDLTTREFPSSLSYSFTSSVGYNTTSTGEERPTYTGGKWDWLGIDDGIRDVPEALSDASWSNSQDAGQIDPVAQERAGESFRNEWTPTRSSTPMNSSFGLSVGNRYALGGNKVLGVSGSFTYSNNYSVEQGSVYREFGGQDIPSADYYDINRGKQSVLWGSLLNASFLTSETSKLSLKGVYTRTADDIATQSLGFDGLGDQDFMETNLRFISRWIGSATLSGEHRLRPIFSSNVHWRFRLSGSGRYDPDNRSAFYSRFEIDDTTTLLRVIPQKYSLNRLYSDLSERGAHVGLDWSVPLSDGGSKLKFGGLFEGKVHDFTSSRYRYVESGRGRPADRGLAEELLIPDNIGARNQQNQWVLIDATASSDQYDVNDHTSATYLMADLGITRALRLVTGIRYEDSRMVVYVSDRSIAGADTVIAIRTGDWLPMASLIYRIREDFNIRGAVSQTVARPMYRELAPFEYQNYAGGMARVGNPDLRPSYIVNYDLRAEYFPRTGEVLAISFFTKDFTDAIEEYVRAATRDFFMPINSPEATAYGLELELRKSLDFIGSGFERLQFGGNLSLIESEVTVADPDNPTTFLTQKRPLQGQSGFTLNLLLGYASEDRKTDVTLLYNSFGERPVRFGLTYEEPYYEKTRHMVDVTVLRRLTQSIRLKVSVKNLLGESFEVTQKVGDVERVGESQDLGTSISLGISYGI
ncbi:MAG: TonB-dependent receptor [Candidatus Zixiibacteriota bacterium]